MLAPIRALTVRVTVDRVQALRVSAAQALRRIERRADLAVPHLTRAREDECWGVARTAVETLGKMGAAGQPAATALIALAKKRLASGPVHFGLSVEGSGREPPVPPSAEIARTLGRCAADRTETRASVSEIAREPDGRVRAVADAELAILRRPAAGPAVRIDRKLQ